VEESPLVQDKNLTELISLVRESKTAADLETSLAPVKFGIGNTHSRRTLKRAIEQVLTREEVEGSMNAKIRRRITRVVKALSPGEYPSGPTPPSSSYLTNQRHIYIFIYIMALGRAYTLYINHKNSIFAVIFIKIYNLIKSGKSTQSCKRY
jgi:hypothetical protein